MEPLVTAAEIREMDRQTIEDLGLPGVVLMENAGRATAAVVLREVAATAAGRAGRRAVAILCGGGNNGGDGFVVARHLHQAGVPCAVYLTKDPAELKGDAAVNLAVLQRLPVPLVRVPDEATVRERAHDLRTAPVVVDALLGTGLNSEVKGVPRALIETANAGLGRRVAIDIPSGIRADDGAVLGAAFRADVTVTFAAAKLGLLLHPGAEYAGAVEVVDIGIPPQVVAAVAPKADRITWREVTEVLAPRPRTGHKGTFGHCLVIAGAPGKGGAALLAGRGALVAGAGLVTVATDRVVRGHLEGREPALMIEWLRDSAETDTDRARLEGLLARRQTVVVGPGLGDSPATEGLVLDVVRIAEVPIVIDADGLNVLARHPGALARATAPVVLTPHPGEMGRLLGCSAAAVQSDRVGAARRLAAREDAVVVLKGARTLVATPDGLVGVNTTGNPGLGSAGTGDVLAGLLGGLLAQGLSPAAAARAAVQVHGAAGDLAAETTGERGLTADAVLAALPRVLGQAERAARPADPDRPRGT